MHTVSISKPADNSKISSCFGLGLNFSSPLSEDQYFVLCIDQWVSDPYTSYNGEIEIKFQNLGYHKIYVKLFDGATMVSYDCVCVEVVNYACSSCGYSPCCCVPTSSCCCRPVQEKTIALVNSEVLDCKDYYCIGKSTSVVIVEDVCGLMLKLYLPRLQQRCGTRSIVYGREIKVLNNSENMIIVCPCRGDVLAPEQYSASIESGDCVTFFEHNKWYFC